MGCFDTVRVTCPVCQEPAMIQTKSGPCRLKVYDERSVPVAVAAGVIGEKITCKCGVEYQITVPPLLTLSTVEVDHDYPED